MQTGSDAPVADRDMLWTDYKFDMAVQNVLALNNEHGRRDLPKSYDTIIVSS